MSSIPPPAEPPEPRPDVRRHAGTVVRGHAHTVVRQSWSAFHPIPALYALPVLALVLVGGLALGQPGAALLAASGAFSSGFGAYQQVTRFRAAPMVLAAFCMAISTAIGTVISSTHPDIYVFVVGLAAFGLGLAAGFGTGPWWVLLQGTIFLVVACSRPGDMQEALSRASLVLAGGLLQSLSVSLLRRLFPAGFPALSAPNALPPPADRAEWQARARQAMSLGSPEMRYATLLGVATATAIVIERALPSPNRYWVALTVLLILRRGGTETLIRGAQRIVGTLIGAGVATLLAAVLRPEPALLVMLILAAAGVAYATQWVNYGTFSASVTSYIAFLLALDGLPELTVASHRVTATMVGGAIGIVALAMARVGRRAMRLSG